MTTYTFDPLIGMTGELDAAGKQTFYNYDAFNRLSFVRNENKDILKSYCYNYANLPIPCATNLCPAPVITAASKVHTTITVHYTFPSNGYNCKIRITDLTDNETWVVDPDIPTICSSPKTVTVPNQLHNYKVEVLCSTDGCNMTASQPWYVQ